MISSGLVWIRSSPINLFLFGYLGKAAVSTPGFSENPLGRSLKFENYYSKFVIYLSDCYTDA